METVEILDGGADQDLARRVVSERWLARIDAGEFDVVHIAAPCGSFSPNHAEPTRTLASREGAPSLSPEMKAYVSYHNRLVRFSAAALVAASASATLVSVENSAARHLTASPAYWREMADLASFWDMPVVKAALELAEASPVTFAMCAFGAEAQKWTTIAATGALAREILGWSQRVCTHGYALHAERARGWDAHGRSRAKAAGAYTAEFCGHFAAAIVRAAHAEPGAGAKPAPATEDGDGSIASGAALGPVTRAACEAARTQPPPFASLRNECDAPAAELKQSPYPYDSRAPMQPKRPGRTPASARRQPLPAPMLPPTSSAAPATERPVGLIAIRDLYLEGVYEAQVVTWLALCDASVVEVQAGRQALSVPTRVIPESSMQPWARPYIWDCSDPCDCCIVQRSTRHTLFPGERQLDRAAVRRVAEEMAWHDDDLISQIGEGGIEVRSTCSRDTVLAFHHPSLFAELPAAAGVVRAHQREEWVSPVTRHLPYVPCRLQPRGVIMQSRTKLAEEGGGVVEYLKPRVTTDASAGGIASVNAGVKSADRAVQLPTAQSLARAWAIADSSTAHSARTAAEPRARGYAIDAESAYSFCVVQQEDLWMQVFLWWDEAGSCGFAVDRRMGFGGSFAPNRFQRLSSFSSAYAQLLQAHFDATAPMPARAQGWSADRAALQRMGLLPPGPHEAIPAYLQSFIDDLLGVALNDIVEVPAWLPAEERAFAMANLSAADAQRLREGSLPAEHGVAYATAHMEAAGCFPSPPNSRVGVHARLVAVAIRRLGLRDAPQKTMVGCPLPSLGLRVDGDNRRLDCPKGKRDVVVADADEQRRWAEEELRVDRRRAHRLVGRLCNISQVAPALRSSLHGGYGVISASWQARGRQRAPRSLTLARHSPAYDAWVELLELASALVAANPGVSMAPPLTFPGRGARGTVTCVSDASGDDGVGAYAFLAGRPDTVWVFSEDWPSDVKAALAASASVTQAELRREGSPLALSWCPVSAAELFGHLVLPCSPAFDKVSHIYSVGDCEPATRVISSLHSGNPKLRAMLPSARAVTGLWLGVHVRRQFNVDCDRLSHPRLADEVMAEATAAGLIVRRVREYPGVWDSIRLAIAQPSPARGARRRGVTAKRPRSPHSG